MFAKNPPFCYFDVNYLYNLVIPLTGVALLYKIYKTFFEYRFQHWYMARVHTSCDHLKRVLFIDAIENITSASKENLQHGRICILEVGIGAGQNFKYFPENANVQFMDKTFGFLPYLKESFKQRPDLQMHVSSFILSKAEDMRAIQSNSVDMLVHTFVLSSASDCAVANAEIHRVLKSGGVRVFLEYCQAPSLNGRVIQRLVNPFCQLLLGFQFKNIKHILLNTSDEFKIVIDVNIKSVIPFIKEPIIYGYSVKN